MLLAGRETNNTLQVRAGGTSFIILPYRSLLLAPCGYLTELDFTELDLSV